MVQWKMGVSPIGSLHFKYPAIFHWTILGGRFKYFLFSPLLGEDSHVDEHIFQMGGSTTPEMFNKSEWKPPPEKWWDDIRRSGVLLGPSANFRGLLLLDFRGVSIFGVDAKQKTWNMAPSLHRYTATLPSPKKKETHLPISSVSRKHTSSKSICSFQSVFGSRVGVIFLTPV